MKKIIVLVLMMVAITGIFCKSPSGPDPIPPVDPAKYYHLEITYTRVAVRAIQFVNFKPMSTFGRPDRTTIEADQDFIQFGNFEFKKTLKNVVAAGQYCLVVYDPALYDGKDKGLCITGIRVDLRVVETNSVCNPVLAVPNIFTEYVDTNESSTMAVFDLSRDGQVTNPPITATRSY